MDSQSLPDPSRLHPSCRALLEYWEPNHRAPGVLPGRQHFEPLDVAPILPHVWLVEVHREPLRFRYRLLGSHIDWFHGKSLAGQWLHETYADEPTCPLLLADYIEIVETRAPAWRRGPPRVVRAPQCREVEALRLPLAADGRSVDMVLGVSLYFDETGLLVRTGFHRAG